MADQIAPAITIFSTKRASEMTARRDALAKRLDDGYARIEQATQAGIDIAAWEDFWILLLREYEAVCDELAAAA